MIRFMYKIFNESIGDKLILVLVIIIQLITLQFDLLMLVQLFGIVLTIELVAGIGWSLGALVSLILPFYLKIRAGTLTWSDFNAGYLINFFITILLGIGASLAIFALWTIPQGSQMTVFVISFFASSGFDSELMKRILKWIGVYEKYADR